MPLSALRYLQATAATLEAGVQDSYKNTELSDGERDTLAEAIQIVSRIERDHFGNDPTTPFYEEHIAGTRLEERMK